MMANDHIADDRKKVRLIDANAYPCQTCEVSYCYKNCEKFNAWFNKTVDAVEVCRCKDCKYYDNSEGIQWCHLNSKFFPSGLDWHCFPEDGFCNYGERRTENGNQA